MIQCAVTTESGCPFWRDYAQNPASDPRRETHAYDGLRRLGEVQDEWLRGGPVSRWGPRGCAGKPIFVFETGGSTGVPKSRIASEDFRLDYEAFSATLPDDALPKGADRNSIRPAG